jgi:hypothetical protein
MTDFTLYQGDTRRIVVTVQDAAGQPVGLVGVAAKWQAAPGTADRFSPTAVITKEIGAGIEITDGVAGELTISLAPEDTAGLTGTYYHELQITDASGDITTVLTGTMTVRRSLVV